MTRIETPDWGVSVEVEINSGWVDLTVNDSENCNWAKISLSVEKAKEVRDALTAAIEEIG